MLNDVVENEIHLQTLQQKQFLRKMTLTTQDLEATEANAKIKQLAESIDFAMLCTDLVTHPFHAVPMSTKRVDENGSIWFLSGRDSRYNTNILRNSSVQLIYADPSSMRFLIVAGKARIVDERSVLESLYQKSDDAWFKGNDDPNLTAIEIDPQAAHYWDVKGGRLVALWRMGVAVMTGVQADIGQHGDLKV